MRLNRYLAACGLTSRRGAEALITAGRVRVNGEVITDLATFVEPGRDRVEVDGVEAIPEDELVYLLLHKPVGFITTVSDPHRRPTIMSLVPPRPRLFPVGRLDLDTSGALLLTNDGPLAHRLLHPRYKVDKEYLVLAEGPVGDEALESLRRGILLEGELRPTAPARVEVTGSHGGRTQLTLVIREGRKRQVRNMMAAVGHRVVELKRLRFGPITLGDLPEGTHRLLTPDEVKALRRLVQGAGASGQPPRTGEEPDHAS